MRCPASARASGEVVAAFGHAGEEHPDHQRASPGLASLGRSPGNRRRHSAALFVADHGLCFWRSPAKPPKAISSSPSRRRATRKACRASSRTAGHEVDVLAAAAREPRLCPHPLGRSLSPPVIQTQFCYRQLDRRVVVADMKLARRLLESEPLAPYYEYEDFRPGRTERRGASRAHPARCTTGLSIRAAPAAYRPRPTAIGRWSTNQLRVHGLQGLRVIDASIVPRMISASLNASTMMIADKASDMIRGKTRPAGGGQARR